MWVVFRKWPFQEELVMRDKLTVMKIFTASGYLYHLLSVR
jgi:hypothetical protein